MPRKNLKVSEIVHEELEVRKRRDESFDDVLKRELEIIPGTVGDLTTYYPESLQKEVKNIHNLIRNQNRYDEIVTEKGDSYALNYDSKKSGRTIMQLRFETASRPEVDIRFRNVRGELQSIGQLLQQEGDERAIVDLEFLRPDTGDLIDEIAPETERIEGAESGIKSIEEAAFERWG